MRNRVTRGIVLVLLVVGVLALCVFVWSARKKSPAGEEPAPQGPAQMQPPPPVAPEETALPMYIEVEGVPYRRNTSLKTVLFLGVDQSEEDRDTVMLGGGGRADAILLMILDPTDETIRMLEINRDTMIDMDVYSSGDEFLYQRWRQLTLQYSVGSSATRSNWLMKNKVSELLLGMPVDHVLSLTVDGIVPVVDALGGISLTFEADYTAIDPDFVEGRTMTLNAEQAYRFARTRDTAIFGSNRGRMGRHRQLLRALADRMRSMSFTQLQELMDAAGSSMTTELDTEVLDRMRHYALQEEIYSLPGQLVEGEDHDEFLVEEEALRALMIELFYIPA